MRQADRQHENDAGGEASGGDGVRMEAHEPSAKYLAGAQFQVSEVGLIPLDWEVIALATRAAIQSGIAKNTNATLRDPISVPYLRVANVQDGYLDLGEVSTIDIERTDLRRYAVLPGDVLMNEGGDLDKLGRGAIWNGQIRSCVHQNHVFVVRCGQGLIPEYLNAWTSSAQARRYFVLAGRQTTNLASINKTSLGELTVAVPPTEREQHEIAAALTDADALIDSLEQLLTKKRQIKQGAMQELLTGKRRLPGFSRPWAAVRLGDIGRTYGGLTGKSKVDFGHGSAKYVTFMNVMTNVTMTLDQVERVDIGPAESQNRVQPGDLLFNGSSETPEEVAFCSRVQACNEDVYLNSFCFGFRPSGTASISELFMAYFFRARPGRLAVSSLAQGATRYNISKAALLQAPLTLPDVMEQHAIAETLSVLDSEMTALEARLTKARALKQAMAQALLTGRIRLVARAA